MAFLLRSSSLLGVLLLMGIVGLGHFTGLIAGEETAGDQFLEDTAVVEEVSEKVSEIQQLIARIRAAQVDGIADEDADESALKEAQTNMASLITRLEAAYAVQEVGMVAAMALLEGPVEFDHYTEEQLAAAMHGIAFGWDESRRWDGDLSQFSALWQSWLRSDNDEERQELFERLVHEWREPMQILLMGRMMSLSRENAWYLRAARQEHELSLERQQNLRRAWYHLPPGPTKARWLSIASGLAGLSHNNPHKLKRVEVHHEPHYQGLGGQDWTPLWNAPQRRRETLDILFQQANLISIIMNQWGQGALHDILLPKDVIDDSDRMRQVLSYFIHRDIGGEHRLIAPSVFANLFQYTAMDPIDIASAKGGKIDDQFILAILIINSWVGGIDERVALLEHLAAEEEPVDRYHYRIADLRLPEWLISSALIPPSAAVLEPELDRFLAQALSDSQRNHRHYLSLFRELSGYLDPEGEALAVAKKHAHPEIAFKAGFRLLQTRAREYPHAWVRPWLSMDAMTRLEYGLLMHTALRTVAAHDLLDHDGITTLTKQGLTWVTFFDEERFGDQESRIRRILGADWSGLDITHPDIHVLTEFVALAFADNPGRWQEWTDYLAQRIYNELPEPQVAALVKGRPILAAQLNLLRGDIEAIEAWWNARDNRTSLGRPSRLRTFAQLQGWRWPTGTQLLRGDVDIPFHSTYQHRFHAPVQRPGVVLAAHLLAHGGGRHNFSADEIPWHEWGNVPSPGSVLAVMAQKSKEIRRYRPVIMDYLLRYGLPMRNNGGYGRHHVFQRELTQIATFCLDQDVEYDQLPWLLQFEVVWQQADWGNLLQQARDNIHRVPYWMWDRVMVAAWQEGSLEEWKEIVQPRLSQQDHLSLAFFFQQQGDFDQAEQHFSHIHIPAVPNWLQSKYAQARWRQAMALGDADAAQAALQQLRSSAHTHKQQAWLAHAQALVAAMQGDDAPAIQQWFRRDAGMGAISSHQIKGWAESAQHPSWRRHCMWYFWRRYGDGSWPLDIIWEAVKELQEGDDLIAQLAQRIHATNDYHKSVRLSGHWSYPSALPEEITAHTPMLGLRLTPSAGPGLHTISDHMVIQPNLWPHHNARQRYRQIGQGHWIYLANTPRIWIPGERIILKRVNGQDRTRHTTIKPIIPAEHNGP